VKILIFYIKYWRLKCISLFIILFLVMKILSKLARAYWECFLLALQKEDISKTEYISKTSLLLFYIQKFICHFFVTIIFISTYPYRLYIPLFALLTIALPVGIPCYFWSESLWISFWVNFNFRFSINLNIAFSVNSVAHMWGQKPYDKYVLNHKRIEDCRWWDNRKKATI